MQIIRSAQISEKWQQVLILMLIYLSVQILIVGLIIVRREGARISQI